VARFYERYGHILVWALTAIVGLVGFYWGIVLCAQHRLLSPWATIIILDIHGAVSAHVVELIAFFDRNARLIGGLATIGTFAVGFVTAIRQAQRQLPARLMEFMLRKLPPVYMETEALVAAVADRRAYVGHGAALFRRKQLDRALDALGKPWRPRRKSSLDEFVKEVDSHLDVTRKRLEALEEVRAHALVLRGARRCADAVPADAEVVVPKPIADAAEKDFTAASARASARCAALEMRGLLRARTSNLDGALADFEQVETYSNDSRNVVATARAMRLQAEIYLKKAASRNAALLTNEARPRLNSAKLKIELDRALDEGDWLELALNREACGTVQAEIALIRGGTTHLARKEFDEALRNARLLPQAKKEVLERRIQAKLAALPSVPLDSPNGSRYPADRKRQGGGDQRDQQAG
jgi:hypothetical protein